MTIALYTKYRYILDATPFTGRLMPYDWINLSDLSDPLWLPYTQMLGEFSSELANTINTFSRNVHRLQAWSETIQSLTDHDKLEATIEFIDTLATNSVNLPYVIRSRFAFAAAHLCHQANRTKSSAEWKDDLPLDADIWLNTADIYGRRCRSYNFLKSKLEIIAANKFREATADFRNSYNHRFSPRFVIGMTGLVSRITNEATGNVSYGFGGRQPLDLGVIGELLAQERDRCYGAFAALQSLVREHEIAIRQTNAIKY